MAASQSVAGEQIKGSGSKKADAGRQEQDVQHDSISCDGV
jgi:hypothetical protein